MIPLGGCKLRIYTSVHNLFDILYQLKGGSHTCVPPNTNFYHSNVTILLLVVAMFDYLLGIGVVLGMFLFLQFAGFA